MNNFFLVFLKIKYLFFVVLIAFITYLGIGGSLKFGLNGDDWQALYFYLTRFTTFESHFDFKNFATGVSNYTFAHIIMGLIYRVFSFNPFPFYLFSMVFRIVAALSFYLAAYSITKTKLVAYLSSIFFAVMFAGIETTNWVFNMNTYVSISLFNLFLYLYYYKEFNFWSKRSLLSSLVLTISFMITQNRMHGLLFLIPILVFSKIRYFNKKVCNNFFIGITVLYLPIFLFRFLTKSSSDISYTPNFLQSLTQWKILILSLFSSIGNAMLPEKLYDFFKITNQSKALLAFSILFLFYLFLFKEVSNEPLPAASSGVSRKRDKFLSNHSSPQQSCEVFWFNNKKNLPRSQNKKYFFVLIFLLIPVIFLIMPLFVYGLPTTFSSDHRYLIIPGAYILIAFAILLTDLWQSSKKIYKGFSAALITLIVIINFVSLRNYFHHLADNGRLVKDIDKQFSFIISNITPNKNAPLVFLFLADNPFKLYNSITFGFPYHMMLIDKRFGLDLQKSPFPVDNMKSLLDVLAGPDSSELRRYGYDPVQIPLENVYFFKFEHNILTNVTEEEKRKLNERADFSKKI